MKHEINNKPNKFHIAIFISLWLLLIGGLSYAYFSVAFNNDEKTTTQVVSGQLAIDFETDEYIDNDSMWPIDDDNIFTNGDKSTFSIKRSQTNTVNNVYYDIWLDEIVISDNYKSADIKWKLFDEAEPTASSTPVSWGSFANIGNRTSLQLTSQKISLPEGVTHNYSLYIWINNSNVNNYEELQGGSIEGKIKVEAVTE